jgi:hypothetical protein
MLPATKSSQQEIDTARFPKCVPSSRQRRIDALGPSVHAPRAGQGHSRREGTPMFKVGDLFQWERFITPSIIKLFYWLAVAITVLTGLYGVISSFRVMAYSPIAGLIMALICVAAVLVGVIFARIAAEFVLIIFRINEHLGAIRNRGGM